MDSNGEYSISVNQNDLNGSVLLRVVCIPTANKSRVSITYNLNDDTYFAINKQNGVVRLQTDAQNLPAETNVTVQCSHKRLSLTNTTQLSVIYLEVNEYAPVFHDANVTLSIPEDRNVAQNPHVVTLNATDQDRGQYSEITFLIRSGNDGGIFMIGSETGEISLVTRLDYETATSYQLTVYASNPKEGNMPIKRAKATVEIQVIPVNEERPETGGPSVATASILKNATVGTLIASALPNTGAQITLLFSDTDKGLDHGTIHYSIPNRGKDSQIVRVAIYIYVLSVNCVPTFKQDTFLVEVSESAYIGSHLETIRCELPGFQDEVTTLGITSVDAETLQTFSIDQEGNLTLQHPLDYEQTQKFYFQINCSDSVGQEALTTVDVQVLPENDNLPYFEQPLLVINVSDLLITPPITIGYVKAQDDDLGNGSVLEYTLQTNPFFRLDRDGALILETLPPSVLDNTFVFGVTASDKENMANATLLIVLPKNRGLDSQEGNISLCSQEGSDETSGLYAVIGVLSSILIVFIVAAVFVSCFMCRRTYYSGKVRVSENGNLRVIPSPHDHEQKK